MNSGKEFLTVILAPLIAGGITFLIGYFLFGQPLFHSVVAGSGGAIGLLIYSRKRGQQKEAGHQDAK